MFKTIAGGLYPIWKLLYGLLIMARPHLILKRYNLNNSGSDYKLENVTSKHCPNCNELLFNEINQPEIDYPYVCLYCDENFYNIELKENNNKSDVDLFLEGAR